MNHAISSTFRRAFAVFASLLLMSAVAAQAGEIFSPALPATGTQFLQCQIVNVSGSTQVVTTQAFDSTGAAVSGAHTETLAPGASGGFSIPATAAAMYCKFVVKGNTNNFRASISVLDTTTSPPSIAVALPAY